MLGSVLPGFTSCKPPWLRLSQKPWDGKPLRRQSLSPWQGYRPCPLYFTLLGPQPDQLANDGQDSSREEWPKTGMVMKRPTGKDLGGYRKRGWWTLAPWLWHSLSPHSVCKESPNLLAALLPLLDLSLKQCQRWVWPWAGKGRLPGEIRPKKECIKPCETCFVYTLSLNDKGPSLKWVCFPKLILANWPWLRISPHSSLNVIYCLIITAWQWLMSFMYMPCIPMQINPIKTHWGKSSWPFSFERLATFTPQADHVLVDLFSAMAAAGRGRSAGGDPPHLTLVT